MLYIIKILPHWLREDRQATALACFLAPVIAGTKIAISSAITVITTKSSVKVSPEGLRTTIVFLLPRLLCTFQPACSKDIEVNHINNVIGWI